MKPRKVAACQPLFWQYITERLVMNMNVLFIGDIVGNVGRTAVKKVLPALKIKYNPHIIIANGENAAAGRGITAAIVKELFDAGVHGITMGNHTWDNKDIFEWIDDEPRIVRPANFRRRTPGQGACDHQGQRQRAGDH